MSFMARTQALANALMNPSLTPVFFSTSSLYNFLNSIILDMSTSLNVVRDAAVFCDCLRRSAILSRMRFIFTCRALARNCASAGWEEDILWSLRGFRHQKVRLLASSHPFSMWAYLRLVEVEEEEEE